MKQLLHIVLLSQLLLGCNSKVVKDPELHNLASFFIGEFSNQEQVKNDPEFTFLTLINIEIWKDRPGYWIYSEVFDEKDNNYIYSQRIICYERVNSSTFKSTNYKISNAKKYTNGWKKKRIFNKLTLDSLEIREGCEVLFKKNTSTIFSGKTKKKSCTSTIDYVNYISSNFVVSRDKISIWNRGYDKNGKLVWGKIKGPYKYKRISKKQSTNL